jgi:hypothetical protein
VSKLAVFCPSACFGLSIFGMTLATAKKSHKSKHMKSLFTTCLVLISTVQLLAQASAVVFSEAGEKFTVYLNGEKKNPSPLTNVKLEGLTSDFYQARIDFEDALLKDFAEGNFAVQQGSEVTYIVKKNKKGEYVLRYYGQTEGTAVTNTTNSNTEIKSFAEVDETPVEEDVQINQSISIQEQPATKTTVTQTTTTTTKTQPTQPSGGNVSMGINVDGMNMGISINASEMGGSMNMDVQETQHTTVTTTTTTTSTQSEPTPRPAARPAAKPAPAASLAQPAGRCASSMAPASFSKAKDTISSSSFEDSKLTVAKQVTKANCPTAAQIAEIMGLFSFEETKMEYAKFAYDFCYNQGDYYEVNTAFTFESSIEELNKYLESK